MIVLKVKCYLQPPTAKVATKSFMLYISSGSHHSHVNLMNVRKNCQVHLCPSYVPLVDYTTKLPNIVTGCTVM